MVWYVVEFQTNEGQGSAIVTAYTNEQTARQAYYQVMAAASVSQVKKHGALLVTEDLFKVLGEIAPKAVEPVE